MDVYSFFLGWAQITEMSLKKVKWIAVSYWKTPTGVDFLQHLIPGKFITSYNCLSFRFRFSNPLKDPQLG